MKRCNVCANGCSPCLPYAPQDKCTLTIEATAALLDDIDGTIFTAGDNVYESDDSAGPPTPESMYMPKMMSE